MRSLILASFVIASAAPAVASPLHATPRLALGLGSPGLELELVPRGLVDQMVRWQRELRDVLHRTAAQLATLAAHEGLHIPDLAVLTTEPVANTESSGFGWRDDPIRHRPKFHSGTDFRGKRGTPVLAAGDGVVVFAGRRGGYGNVIDVDHGGGVITRYAHLRRIEAKRDAAVVAGEQIGQLGSTGRATGPHLHFEVRLDGRPVDPVTAMSVAELARESAELGRIAAFALSPEVQAEASSRLDPPRQRVAKKAKKAKHARPDRPGRVKRVRPVS